MPQSILIDHSQKEFPEFLYMTLDSNSYTQTIFKNDIDIFSYRLYIPKGIRSHSSGTSVPLVIMLHGCDQTPEEFAEETQMNELAEKENFIVLYPEMNNLADWFIFRSLLFNPYLFYFLTPLQIRWLRDYVRLHGPVLKKNVLQSYPGLLNWVSQYIKMYPFFSDYYEELNSTDCWNWFFDENQHRDKGQPQIIIEIIDQAKSFLEDEYHILIDEKKTYAAGFSAGAAMTAILGATYPDRFHKIAICAGVPYNAAKPRNRNDLKNIFQDAASVMETGVEDPYECGDKAFEEMEKGFEKAGKRTLPVLILQGTDDSIVRRVNGDQVFIQWAQTNFRIEGGQGRVPTSFSHPVQAHENGRDYKEYIYKDKNGYPLVQLRVIEGLEHKWSGGNVEGSYTDPHGPKATEHIWRFFNEKTPSL
ncbi:PHB depolymerase family esterase [Ammoniphilus sp. 3BR4]|uniref:extracellular catalytic domain type 1 short-chain-length polyhydroxyalkanoate depolymerase n=1 Tax=Ammoniphilus sp. 3BR4 TaxID=3158265 RepID=UPI003467A517